MGDGRPPAVLSPRPARRAGVAGLEAAGAGTLRPRQAWARASINESMAPVVATTAGVRAALRPEPAGGAAAREGP